MSTPEPGVEDATRRTHLAAERTWLAWWRTGIAAIGAGIGIGRLLPELAGGTTWPYALIGAGYALVGVGMIWYAQLRQRRLGDALRAGAFEHVEERALRAFTGAGVVLGALTVLLILIEV